MRLDRARDRRISEIREREGRKEARPPMDVKSKSRERRYRFLGNDCAVSLQPNDNYLHLHSGVY